MGILSQDVKLQPIKVEGLPWAWGFECAILGGSLYDGYQFWCGASFLQWERGFLAGRALVERIEKRVLAEVKAALPGAPEDFSAGVADVQMGAHYCKPGIDWAAVENDRVGD